MHGIYREVLDSHLQHSGTHLQHCPRPPQICEAIRGKKTDKRDANWIADIFKHDLVAGSFIPPADIRQLRDLVRYRCKLTNLTLVITAPVSNPLPQSASFLKSEWICPCFPPLSISAPGLGLRRRTTRVPGRRKPPESAGQVLTSSRCSFSALYAPFEPNSFRKSVIAISLSKSTVVTRKPSSPLPGCSLQLSTICSRRTNRTTLNSTARATGHLHTGKFPWKKPSSFYNGKVI